MKKYLLCLVLLFLLVGCQNNNNNNEDQNQEQPGTESKETDLEEIVMVNGVEVNIKDPNEVEKLYDEIAKELDSKKLVIELPQKSYTFGYSDFGVEIDKQKVQSDIDNNKSDITIEYITNDEAISKTIEAIAEENDVEPQNATYKKTDRNFDITSFSFSAGLEGQKINREILAGDIREAIKNKSDVVVATLETIAPKYSLEDVKEATDVLAKSSTDYSTSASDRNENLGVATEKINNQVVYPGETFSTAAAFGPITQENGFKISKVILNNELVDGIGGGVCQVSSTLYNATLKSELEIVERINHSLKVGYMNYAFDATMAEGWIDYRFKNDTEYPILIESYLDTDKRNVIVNIYGKETRPKNRTIELTSKFVNSWTPDDDEIVYVDTMYEDEVEYEKKPINGVKYDLYKNIYIDGVFQESVWINSSTYSSVRGIKRVGTKKASERPGAIPEIPSEVPSEVTPEVPTTEDTTVPSGDTPVDTPIEVEPVEETPDDSNTIEEIPPNTVSE